MRVNEFNDEKLLEIAGFIVRPLVTVSAALLQQRLCIGPNRAANLLQQLHTIGKVIPGLLPGEWVVSRGA